MPRESLCQQLPQTHSHRHENQRGRTGEMQTQPREGQEEHPEQQCRALVRVPRTTPPGSGASKAALIPGTLTRRASRPGMFSLAVPNNEGSVPGSLRGHRSRISLGHCSLSSAAPPWLRSRPRLTHRDRAQTSLAARSSSPGRAWHRQEPGQSPGQIPGQIPAHQAEILQRCTQQDACWRLGRNGQWQRWEGKEPRGAPWMKGTKRAPKALGADGSQRCSASPRARGQRGEGLLCPQGWGRGRWGWEWCTLS